MKIHLQLQLMNQKIEETIEGQDAAALLHMVKQETGKRVPFFLRGIVNGMTDMGFAQEAVRRANQANGRKDPSPASAQDFLDWAVERGWAQVVEP